MAAPDTAETEKFDRMTIQQVKQQDMQRDQQASALKARIDTRTVAPMELVKKTNAAVAMQKVNPRPPSEALNKKAKEESDDDYSDGGGFEVEEAADDLRLERIKQQLAKENAKVAAKVEKGEVGQGPTKVVVKKQGPQAMSTAKGAMQRTPIVEDDVIEDTTPQKKTFKVVKSTNPLKTPLPTVGGGKALPTVNKLQTVGGLQSLKKQEFVSPVKQPSSQPAPMAAYQAPR